MTVDGLVIAQEQTADDTYRRGKDDDQNRPGNADLGGLLQALLGLQAHEANDNVGHTEVAQAPAQAGDDVLPAAEGIKIVGGVHRVNARALEHEQGENRCNEQRTQHQHALEEVRPADGGEAAQEGIGNDNEGGQIHSRRLVHTDNGVKQGAAGLHAGGGVHGIGHQEDHRADDLQGLGLREKAVGQILGNGDGVVGHDGEPTQPGGLGDPADGVADGQTHGDPYLAQTQGVNGGGQTHEHPGAHIGGAGRQRRDPGAHLPAAQEIGFLAAITILKEEIDADGQHKYQINYKYNNFTDFHGFPSYRICHTNEGQYNTKSSRTKYRIMYRM